MKFKLLAISVVFVCSSVVSATGALAQHCRADLINGRDGRILASYDGRNCSSVSRRCNKKLRQLRFQNPQFYRDVYCDVMDISRHMPPAPAPQPAPQAYVTRSYDRCQAPGIVRCTQEWSDGRIVTEDYQCSGCKGYGNPAGDPCGWRCSFPQQ